MNEEVELEFTHKGEELLQSIPIAVYFMPNLERLKVQAMYIDDGILCIDVIPKEES